METTEGEQKSRKAGKQRQAISGQLPVKANNSKTAGKPKKRVGPTKDNRCWVCREPLDQPERGRLRLTCSNACRQRRYRSLHGIMSRQGKREKKLVERRRSKPFIERKFSKTFFEPVFEVNAWLKWYECLACGQPYEVNRMKSGNPPRPYCSNACEQKTKRHWNKFVDAYERAHQRGELDMRVHERFWFDKLSPLCPRCGKPFAPNTTLHGKRKRGRPRKYCSAACAKGAYEDRWKRKHRRARVHRFRDCAECGEKFDRTDTTGRRRMVFCSTPCAQRFMTRAYRERKRMGVKMVIRGKSGHRAALSKATKNKVNQVTCNTIEEINSGALTESLCVESG